MNSKKSSSYKIFRKVLKASLNPTIPFLAQIVITNRCNLSCGYCFEYDSASNPVPLEELKKRIDDLKRLKVVFVTLNGGEPLLHPDAVELVWYISESGMIPMINSNGFLLTPELISKLNDAGLFGIQISCDTIEDNLVTKKSIKRLLPIFEILKANANFKVRINGVLGSGPPNEIIEVAKIATSYGFDFQCSLVRDADGSALPLDNETQEAYQEIRKLEKRLPSFLHDDFQIPLVKGENLNWKCRSGARYFHIDEKGFVHLCQPRTGTPAKKLEDYTSEDIKKYFYMEKECSKRCPHAYAHLGSRMDKFRHQNKKI